MLILKPMMILSLMLAVTLRSIRKREVSSSSRQRYVCIRIVLPAHTTHTYPLSSFSLMCSRSLSLGNFPAVLIFAGTDASGDDADVFISTKKGDIIMNAGIDGDLSDVFISTANDIKLSSGVDSSGAATNIGGDIKLEAKSDSGTNSSGGNVKVNTDGNGDFTVDGSTVLP